MRTTRIQVDSNIWMSLVATMHTKTRQTTQLGRVATNIHVRASRSTLLSTRLPPRCGSICSSGVLDRKYARLKRISATGRRRVQERGDKERQGYWDRVQTRLHHDIPADINGQGSGSTATPVDTTMPHSRSETALRGPCRTIIDNLSGPGTRGAKRVDLEGEVLTLNRSQLDAAGGRCDKRPADAAPGIRNGPRSPLLLVRTFDTTGCRVDQ